VADMTITIHFLPFGQNQRNLLFTGLSEPG
jgi:hypothetical protein